MRSMKLCDLYLRLTTAEVEDLAKKAGTSPAYLWQIATQWRGKKPSLALLRDLADADKRLTIADLVAEFTQSSDEVTPSLSALTNQKAGA